MIIEDRKVLKTVFICSLFAISASCTTLSGKKKNSSLEKAAIDSSSVVLQAGKNVPSYSKQNREYWIGLRSGSKSEATKLYAAVAAGGYEAAIQDAHAHLKANPKNASALIVLASSLALSHNYALAGYYAGLYEKYYDANSETNNIKGLSILMASKVKMKDYKTALSFFQKSFDGSPNEIAGGLNLGHLYLELGNPQSAAEVFESIKGRCRDCVQAYMGAGIAQSRMRQFDKARDNFERVLSTDQNNAQALYRLALVAKVGSNDATQAKRYLTQVVTSPEIENGAVKRRAQSMLRKLEAESSRTASVQEDDSFMDDKNEAFPENNETGGTETVSFEGKK